MNRFRRNPEYTLIVFFVTMSVILALLKPAASRLERMWRIPEPLPAYISGIGTENTLICMGILERPLWERGNFADELGNHLMDNIRFWIDDEPTIPERIYSIMDIIPVWEDERTIGTHGSGLEACFDTAHVRPGLHLATFEVTNLSGDVFNYSWAFHVNGVGRVSVPTFPPTRSSDASR